MRRSTPPTRGSRSAGSMGARSARWPPRERGGRSSCARSRRPTTPARRHERCARRWSARKSALGRRSRKRRKTTPAGRSPTPDATATVEKPPSRSEVAEKPPSRSEQRNAEARARLEPLAPGERPGAVTVAAVVALVLGVGNVIAYAAGLTIDGKRPSLFSIAVPSAIMLVAGIGMWRAKYWAVLGFQALLGILICYLALFMIRASNLLGLIVPLAIILPSGFLFWKLVKSLARIQMPENPSRRPRA